MGARVNRLLADLKLCWFLKWHWTNRQGEYYPHLNLVIGDLAYDPSKEAATQLDLRDIRIPLRARLSEGPAKVRDFLRVGVPHIRRTIGYVCQEPHTTDEARWRYSGRRSLARMGVLGPRTRKMWRELDKSAIATLAT